MMVSTRKLGLSAVPGLPAASRPAVLPGEVPAGVLHLGLGAFHRAHQAVYTERAVATAGGDWGIAAVAPRSRTVLDALAGQDHLFSVTELTEEETSAKTRVVGILADLLHAASDPTAVIARLADPAIRVVTLTVTEKAYRIDPVTGRIHPDDAQLRADLAGDKAGDEAGEPPTTIPGLLVRGLAARARADAGPIAVVSCDNLIANGRTLSGLVDQCAGLLPEPAPVREWLRRNVTFPRTMVDRIVPASTPATFEAARRALGVADEAAVNAEPFSQWVIEDAFPGGRPAWDEAGALITKDVEPWERLKLRVVNGLHSALAYLGAVAGCETIWAAVELPGMRAWLRRFLAEDILPSLSPPDSVDPSDYAEQALARFANPALPYRTLQVAMDGSQKLPQRVLHTALDRRRAGAEPAASALVVAGWLRFLLGRADDGRPLPLDDPLAGPIHDALSGAGDAPASVVDAVFGLDGVFPADLAADATFRRLVTDHLEHLTRSGVRAVLVDAGGTP
jgi:fructuronate reductase